MPLWLQWAIAVLSPVAVVVTWAGMVTSKNRRWIVAGAIAGAALGLFWLVVVDGRVSAVEWANRMQRSWVAYVTCPFTPFIGVTLWVTLLVPALNSFLYGFIAWVVCRCLRRAGL